MLEILAQIIFMTVFLFVAFSIAYRHFKLAQAEKLHKEPKTGVDAALDLLNHNREVIHKDTV